MRAGVVMVQFLLSATHPAHQPSINRGALLIVCCPPCMYVDEPASPSRLEPSLVRAPFHLSSSSYPPTASSSLSPSPSRLAPPHTTRKRRSHLAGFPLPRE